MGFFLLQKPNAATLRNIRKLLILNVSAKTDFYFILLFFFFFFFFFFFADRVLEFSPKYIKLFLFSQVDPVLSNIKQKGYH